MNYKILFVYIFLLNVTINYGQYTLEPIEKHVFNPIFNSTIKNKIHQIIEKNEASKVKRKWVFNDNGKLIKELDYTVKTISTSVEEETIPSTIFNYDEYIYQYNSNDTLEKIIQKQVINGDTLRIKHEFDYSKNNEIKEKYRLRVREFFNKEFFKTTYLSNRRIDSIIFINVTNGKNISSESKTKLVFNYNNIDKVSEEITYFKEKEIHYQITGVKKYVYDISWRLSEIVSYNYDKVIEPKLYSKIKFEYYEDSPQIISLKVCFNTSSNSESITFNMSYDSKGNLNNIKSIYGNNYYHFE